MAPSSFLQDRKKRKIRLKELIKKLEAGQPVQNRAIETIFTRSEWARFSREANGKRGRGQQNTPPYPRELDEYFKRIDRATARYVALEREGSRKRMGRRLLERVRKSADGLFESALERLEEIISDCTGARRTAVEFWLDRPIKYDETSHIDISLDPESVPRKRGSRSRYAEKAARLTGLTAREQKRQIKIKHLRAALDRMKSGRKPVWSR